LWENLSLEAILEKNQLFRDAFFQTDFGVKKTRKIQEKTRKDNKRQQKNGSQIFLRGRSRIFIFHRKKKIFTIKMIGHFVEFSLK
jgi:hypothetical protein